MIILKNSQNTNVFNLQKPITFASERQRTTNVTALGNYTKSAVFSFNTEKVTKNLFRRRRYDLLQTAREVSPKRSRVCSCSQHIGKDKSGNHREYVEIVKKNTGSNWSGISVCGSVWTCPVCSQRIMMSRKNEVFKAMSNHRKNGGTALHITTTFSHTKFNDLDETLKNFSKALSKMKGTKKYKFLKEFVDFKGSIRALEITHSDRNGWHPHTHEIWFLNKTPTIEQIKKLEDGLFLLWKNYCHKCGLGLPTRKHGIKIEFKKGSELEMVGSYVSKWSNELTSSHTKTATKNSRSPWQILMSLNEKWNHKDSELWKKYCESMKGRAMLFWSRGLKKDFCIDELTDEEIAAEEDNKEVLDSLKVTRQEFYAISRLKKLPHVLERFEEDKIKCSEYIDSLVLQDEKIRMSDKKKYYHLNKKIRDYTLKRCKSELPH